MTMSIDELTRLVDIPFPVIDTNNPELKRFYGDKIYTSEEYEDLRKKVLSTKIP